MTLQETIEQIKQSATRKADVVVGLAKYLVGKDYVLGEEPFGYVVWQEQTAEDDDTDCSGLIYGCYRLASDICEELGWGPILWANGSGWPRLTAHGFMLAGKTVTGAPRPGDVCVAYNADGHGYHICLITEQREGMWMEIEARGRAYGVQEHTLAYFKGRYARTVVKRFGWLEDLLTDQTPDEPEGGDEMTQEQFERLDKLGKQSGYRETAMSRLMCGDYAGAAEVNANWYSIWPTERGPFPEGITAEELEGQAG